MANDWAHLYADRQLKRWQLPVPGSVDEENGAFRQLYLTSSELPRSTPDGDELPLWFLCCDVLHLDKDVLQENSVFIFARRIEVSNDATLILDRTEGNSQDLIVFAQEVVDRATGERARLRVQTIGDDETVTTRVFQTAPDATGASGFTWAEGADDPILMAPEDLDPAWMLDGEPLRMALVTTFQVATLLSVEMPALSVSQLRWVANLARASKDTLDLATQANSMAMTLLSIRAAGENALLVPELDPKIYAKEAEACLQLLKQRQQQFDAYQDRLANSANWADAAQAALETRENEKDLAQRLERQAQDTRRQMVSARNIAAQKVSVGRALLVERKFAFDAGIAIWEREKIARESIDLAIGVGKLVYDVGMMVTVGPQMAPLPSLESAEGALELASRGVDALLSSDSSDSADGEWGDDYLVLSDSESDSGPLLLDSDSTSLDDDSWVVISSDWSEPSSTSDSSSSADAPVKTRTKEDRKKAKDKVIASAKSAGADGKQILDAVLNIIKIIETAEKMAARSNAILESAGDAVDATFSTFEVQGLDMVTGGEQEWQLLSTSIEHMFENNGIVMKVEGAKELQLEIRNLIVQGKVLCQARLAMAKANAQLAEMKMRRVAAERAVAIAERRLEKLEERIAQDQTVSQLVFGRVLDARRAVYLAMEAYHRAFRYFALAEETDLPALPRLTATTDAFASAVTKITSEELKLTALIRHNGRKPSPMNVKFVLDDPDLLYRLAKTGIASLVLDMDHDAFRGFARVRFNRVRVYAKGVRANGQIEVRLATSCRYADRVPGNMEARPTFVSKATRRRFIYDGSDPEHITLDGDIAPRYEYDFFAPTPFTTWTLRIGRQDGEDLDLSSIKGLSVEIRGEATPS